MSESSTRIGNASSAVTGGYASVTQTAEGAAARGSVAARPGSGTANVGRGRTDRFVDGSQAPEQLDRAAPRGSYLNILA